MMKRSYVKRQKQTRDHACHWPGCEKQVPPAMWGCYRHWMMLPKYLRDRIWASFAPGQEVTMTPSREYVIAAREIQEWIESNRVDVVALDMPIACVGRLGLFTPQDSVFGDGRAK